MALLRKKGAVKLGGELSLAPFPAEGEMKAKKLKSVGWERERSSSGSLCSVSLVVAELVPLPLAGGNREPTAAWPGGSGSREAG